MSASKSNEKTGKAIKVQRLIERAMKREQSDEHGRTGHQYQQHFFEKGSACERAALPASGRCCWCPFAPWRSGVGPTLTDALASSGFRLELLRADAVLFAPITHQIAQLANA